MTSNATNINDLPSVEASNGENSNPVQNVIFDTGENNPASKPAPTSAFQLSQEDVNKIVTGIQQASQSNLTALPARDIPQEQAPITMDEEAMNPNYIPKPPQETTDYINDNSNYEQILKQQYQASKNETDNFDEMKTPILIAILFFIFQMPFVRKYIFKYFPTLFLNDGNLSFNGILLKSLAFGIFYYIITKVTQMASDNYL